uniref:Uncharacterized protein n=1 Tax=Anopheles melas TaxID=34690 RepID=A0A182TEL3_9DIPT
MAVKYDADADKEGVASGSKAPPSSPIHDDNQTDPTFQAQPHMMEEQYVYYPEDVFVMIQIVRIRWLLRLIITHLVSQVMQPDCNGLRRSSMLRQLHCLVEASDALSTAGQHIRKNHNRYLHESAEQPKPSRQVLSSDSSDEPQEESSSLNERYRSAFGVGARMLTRRKKAAPKEQVQRSASSGRVGTAKPIERAPSPAPVDTAKAADAGCGADRQKAGQLVGIASGIAAIATITVGIIAI